MASVYRKGERWWLRFKGADGHWHGAPARATTKPAARLEALERERLARQQREGLAPSDDNRRRTFGELMDLWQERYGSRLRSQTMKLSVEKHLRLPSASCSSVARQQRCRRCSTRRSASFRRRP